MRERGRLARGACLALFLAGCAGLSEPLGQPSSGIADPALAAAYIPLTAQGFLGERWGAAIVIAPNVAATNAHNANLVPEGAILGQTQAYDLLFFHTDRTTPVRAGHAEPGRAVIAYGQGSDGTLREARGTIHSLAEPVRRRCGDCPEALAITFDADAGRGFSGGPLIDEATGAVVGLVFGFRDGAGENGARRMFAYSLDRVLAEWRRIEAEDRRASPSTSRNF